MISNVYFDASLRALMNISECGAEIDSCLAQAENLAAFAANMESIGWRQVKGPQQGDFSLVMLSMCGNFAVKLFGDTAYNTFLQVAEAHQNNPYFPKIHLRKSLPQVLQGYTQLVVLEKLFAEWEAKGKTNEAVGAYYALKNSGDDFAVAQQCNFYGDDYREALAALADAYRGQTHIKCDLNGRNLMFRADGQLVITDPFAPKFP